MKITIERKYPKEKYCISNVFVNGLWFCNGMEPHDYRLYNLQNPQEDTGGEYFSAKFRAEQALKTFGFGNVAVPRGVYQGWWKFSPKNDGMRLYLANVPGFYGIHFSRFTSEKENFGCILLGKNTRPGWLTDSSNTLATFHRMVKKALDAGEKIIITIR